MMTELLDQARVPDQTIWLVCAMFYLVESIRRHPGRRLILVETLGGNWRLAAPLPGWRLGGRAVTVVAPLLPVLGAVQLPWLTPAPHRPAALRRARRLLALRRRLLLPFRIIAATEAAAVFLAGPLLTERLGIGMGFLIVVPIHLACALGFAVALAAQRRWWRIGWPTVAKWSFEGLLSPGSLANACRKISLAAPAPEVDGMALALALQGQDPALPRRLELMLDDLEQQGELWAGDAAVVAGYSVLTGPCKECLQ
jgi:hypothetical protein